MNPTERPILIAEIGNNHFGSTAKAKEHLRAAVDSGATILKMQAFKASDITWGSMSRDFYAHSEFTLEQYRSLQKYCHDELDILLFFSIFSPELESLAQNIPLKISASQTKSMPPLWLSQRDITDNIFSVHDSDSFIPSRAHVMVASKYLSDPEWTLFPELRRSLWRPIGYSCHSQSPETAVKAYELYGCHIIEKHFVTTKIENYGYRDITHSAIPEQFEMIARKINAEPRKQTI